MPACNPVADGRGRTCTQAITGTDPCPQDSVHMCACGGWVGWGWGVICVWECVWGGTSIRAASLPPSALRAAVASGRGPLARRHTPHTAAAPSFSLAVGASCPASAASWPSWATTGGGRRIGPRPPPCPAAATYSRGSDAAAGRQPAGSRSEAAWASGGERLVMQGPRTAAGCCGPVPCVPRSEVAGQGRERG